MVSCPFDLAVTPELATRAICEVLNMISETLVWPEGNGIAGEQWNERMLICAYLCLHFVYAEDRNMDT